MQAGTPAASLISHTTDSSCRYESHSSNMPGQVEMELFQWNQTEGYVLPAGLNLQAPSIDPRCNGV